MVLQQCSKRRVAACAVFASMLLTRPACRVLVVAPRMAGRSGSSRSLHRACEEGDRFASTRDEEPIFTDDEDDEDDEGMVDQDYEAQDDGSEEVAELLDVIHEILGMAKKIACEEPGIQEQAVQRQSSVNQLACERLLKTRLDFLPPLRTVQIGSSSVDGQGLFATRDMLEGQIMTFYPGDVLAYWHGNTSRPSKVTWDSHVPPELVESIQGDLGRLLSYELSDSSNDGFYSLIGHPELVDDPNYLGHMLNDGAQWHEDDSTEAYERASALSANAEFMCIHGCHYAVVASRRIDRGEEIFASYGLRYWRRHWKRWHDTP